VMIINTFNHRDRDELPAADRADPERWQNGHRDYRINHLSNGTQDCPGGPLVDLLGKAVIARMLDEYELELREPQLDPSQPLPNMLDFFDIRFACRVAA
jgi:cytochrome P450